MKKITLIAALLGSAYFANAQVGINTPSPSVSSMLDVVSTDKGVLIPRVSLKGTTALLVTGVNQETSLLVYNTNTVTDAAATDAGTGAGVAPGFYYWNVNKWERIINQTDLNTAISNVANHQADIDKIKALLNAAYGSNNLGNTATNANFGGMVFTPEAGTYGQQNYVAPVIEYVKWDPAANSGAGGYVKVDVTSQLIHLINANETKTKIVTINNVQYYLSESFNKFTELEVAASATDKLAILNNVATVGFFKIDVINSVVNNFNEILTSTVQTTINGETQTVKEYFESLAGDANGDTKIVLSGDGTIGDPYVASLQLFDGTTWENVPNSAFSTIVTDNETRTTIGQSKDNSNYSPVTTDSKAVDKIVYEYSAENNVKNYISLTDDIKWSIENNQEIKDIIKNLVENGSNVGFTTTAITVAQNTIGTNVGGVIPANSLYYVDANGIKVYIDISDAIVNATTINSDSTTVQKNNVTKIKQNLGDKIVNNTSVFTGDTIDIGGTVYYIYKGNFTSVVTAKTAVSTGFTLDKANVKILSMDLKYARGLSSSVTDLVLSGTDDKTVAFNIGTGKMYQVLGDLDVNVEVMVEFASSVTPLLP